MAVRYLKGDCAEVLRQIKSESFNTCVTSPPYWGLRDYGVDGQLGLESTPEEYVDKLVGIFREVKRVLKDDGTFWLNLGDSYCRAPKGQVSQSGIKQGKNSYQYGFQHTKDYGSGLKEKDLVGIPWMVAFALREDGWYLRSDIIWHKGNCMPESVKDRPTKTHEYIFLLSKNKKYYYDADSIRENVDQVGIRKGASRPLGGVIGEGRNDREIFMEDKAWVGRNKRSVWKVNPKPFKDAHFAVYPPELITPCIKAGCPEGGWVLDPFGGSGTTADVSRDLSRNCVLIDINDTYNKMQYDRSAQMGLWEQTDDYESEADEIIKEYLECQ